MNKLEIDKISEELRGNGMFQYLPLSLIMECSKMQIFTFDVLNRIYYNEPKDEDGYCLIPESRLIRKFPAFIRKLFTEFKEISFIDGERLGDALTILRIKGYISIKDIKNSDIPTLKFKVNYERLLWYKDADDKWLKFRVEAEKMREEKEEKMMADFYRRKNYNLH